MIYYMIRHKATGEFMPELKRTRGYSWWNPTEVITEVGPLKGKLLGVPRLIATRRRASRCISLWNAYPNGRYKLQTSYQGEVDDFVDTTPDGRSKDDLEIIEVEITERK